jgi:hypothetical protein
VACSVTGGGVVVEPEDGADGEEPPPEGELEDPVLDEVVELAVDELV